MPRSPIFLPRPVSLGLAVLGAACVMTAAPADARDIFVNNLVGSDDLAGLKPTGVDRNGPVKTINRALALAEPGDTISIAKTAEPYREAIAISGCRLRGGASRPLRLVSDGAVLDGSVAAADGAWRHVEGDVFTMRPRRLAFQQLFRDGAPLTRVRLVSRGAASSLDPLDWALVGGALMLRTEPNRLPASYGLRHAGLQTGITLYNTRGVEIEGLVVQGFQQDGVNAHGLATDVVLRNLECRANGRAGLSIGEASRVEVTASNFYDNGRVQVRCEPLGRGELRGCDIDDEGDTPAFAGPADRLTVDGKPWATRLEPAAP